MVKKFFSHYAPRPLQQPQMPDMKQVKRSVCNHIRHFSLLSFPPLQFCRVRPHLTSQQLNHHHSTNHAKQFKVNPVQDFYMIALPCGRRWNAVPSVRRGATDPLQFTICRLQATSQICKFCLKLLHDLHVLHGYQNLPLLHALHG